MIDEKHLYTYDIEVYPNLFTLVAINHFTDTYTYFYAWEDENGDSLLLNGDESWETWEKVHQFFNSYKTFVGYFSSGYDNLIIAYIRYVVENYGSKQLSCKDLKDISNKIIESDTKPYNWYFKDYWISNTIDLYEVLKEGRTRTAGSLKAISVKLKYPITQECPIPFDQNVTTISAFNDILGYNINDVDVTYETFKTVKDSIDLRIKIAKDYNSKYLITAGKSKISKTLFTKWYLERTKTSKATIYQNRDAYKHCLPEYFFPDKVILKDENGHYLINFKTKEFQECFNNFLNTKIIYYKDKQKYEYERQKTEKGATKKPDINFKLNGKTFSVGLGGLHSEDEPALFYPNDDEEILDIDVGSQYPNTILNYKIAPSHLNQTEFLEMYAVLVKERLKSKDIFKNLEEEGNTNCEEYIKHKNIADTFKISINAGYGFLNDQFFFFYDPIASYKVTVNCQLFLLMLIEELDTNDGITVLSANTDGIIIRVKNYAKDNFKEIKNRWEKYLNYKLEDTYYSKYVRNNVNDYIAQEVPNKQGKQKVKNKGLIFASHKLDLLKGYNYPIIGIALENYFLYEKPIMDTLQKHNDIYDFCFFKKASHRKDENDSGWDVVLLDKVELWLFKCYKNPEQNAKYIIYDTKITQFINRFYIYRGDDYEETENYIKKRGHSIKVGKQNFEGGWNFQKVSKGRVIKLFNNYFSVNIDDENYPLKNYNIDYDFYYNECKKWIDKIELQINPY